MINEDQLERFAIQWFQDTGWSFANSAKLAAEGATELGEIDRRRPAVFFLPERNGNR